VRGEGVEGSVCLYRSGEDWTTCGDGWQWVVELEAGWIVLEFERERSERRAECALPGAVRLEPRPVASGRCVVEPRTGWRCWSSSGWGGSGGVSMPFREWWAEATASGHSRGVAELEVGWPVFEFECEMRGWGVGVWFQEC
jgi:hypothetical protein